MFGRREQQVSMLHGHGVGVMSSYASLLSSLLRLSAAAVLASRPNPKPRSNSNTAATVHNADVVFAGGGGGSVVSALVLNEYFTQDDIVNAQGKRPTIIIVEAGDQVLPRSCTTSIQPGRLGVFHYTDYATRENVLHATLDLVELLLRWGLDPADFMQDFALGRGHPRNRGHHGILRGTVDADMFIADSERLRNAYRQRAHINPRLKEIYGEPEDFFRILSAEKANKVFAGIASFSDEMHSCILDTAERLFDVEKLTALLRQRISEAPNIQVLNYHRVISLSHDNSQQQSLPQNTVYAIDETRFKRNGDTTDATGVVAVNAPVVAAATWTYAPYHLATTGAVDPIANNPQANRLKAKILVAAPPEFASMPSLLTSFRDGCMVTNKGPQPKRTDIPPGWVLLHATSCQSTNVTNHKLAEQLKPPTNYSQYLDGTVTSEEVAQIEKNILEDVKRIFSAAATQQIDELLQQASRGDITDAKQQVIHDEIARLTAQTAKLDTLQIIPNTTHFGTVQLEITEDDSVNVKDERSAINKRTETGFASYPEAPGLFRITPRKFVNLAVVANQFLDAVRNQGLIPKVPLWMRLMKRLRAVAESLKIWSNNRLLPAIDAERQPLLPTAPSTTSVPLFPSLGDHRRSSSPIMIIDCGTGEKGLSEEDTMRSYPLCPRSLFSDSSDTTSTTHSSPTSSPPRRCPSSPTSSESSFTSLGNGVYGSRSRAKIIGQMGLFGISTTADTTTETPTPPGQLRKSFL